MKTVYYYFFLMFFVSIGFAPSCILEKETDIPSTATNLKKPFFDNTSVSADTNHFLRVTATLNILGNLNIKAHGWVWGEAPNPTLDHNYHSEGALSGTIFSDTIAGLDLGKVYYLRPYVINSADSVYYGEERCSFVGVNFIINTDREVFKGARVTFTNTSAGDNTYLWNFGDGFTSTEKSPTHQYDTLGKMTVRLIASNGGCISIRTNSEFLNIIPDPFEDYWAEIPGGAFLMGCTPEQGSDCNSDELPVHQVTLSPFSMGKTEITHKQWRSVVNYSPSYFYQCGDNCPVEFVSWNQIVEEFIPALYKKTGKVHRLPTEAEWEYAARGGQPYKYSGSDNPDLVAFYSGGINGPLPVAQLDSNGYGLYDMSGNVWEYCADWSAIFEPGPVINPMGPATGEYKVVRGGGFGDDEPSACRVSFRGGSSTKDYRGPHIGFRIVQQN